MEEKLPHIYANVGVDYDERVLPSITTEVLKAVVVSLTRDGVLACCLPHCLPLHHECLVLIGSKLNIRRLSILTLLSTKAGGGGGGRHTG